MEQYHAARTDWLVRFDLEANTTYYPGVIEVERRKTRRGGRNEVTDFVAAHPPPTLKQFLLAHAGLKDQEHAA